MTTAPDSRPIILHEACKLVAKLNGCHNTKPSTLRLWIKKGVRLPSGRRLKLLAKRGGGRWCVTRANIEEFFARLTEAHLAE